MQQKFEIEDLDRALFNDEGGKSPKIIIGKPSQVEKKVKDDLLRNSLTPIEYDPNVNLRNSTALDSAAHKRSSFALRKSFSDNEHSKSGTYLND